MSTTQNISKRNYVILLIADFVSSFGSAMSSLAIMLSLYQITSNLMMSAMFSFITLTPKIILSPFLSKISLKCSYRLIFLIGELLNAAAFAIFYFNDSVPVIFTVYTIFGVIFFVLECYRADFLKTISDEKSIYQSQSISRASCVLLTILTAFWFSVISQSL